ncbi:hypothetical protein JCM24511_03640 [Saitozyma sp. JCM 24511]|nr:hypothetical protein JCM24511_03640 [Saitozyma sp. JCM 24511]
MDFAVAAGFISMLSAARQMSNPECVLTGRGTKDGISIHPDADDEDLAIVRYPRGVSTWGTDEPTTSAPVDPAPGPSVTPEHDDYAITEREKESTSGEKDATSRDRPTKLLGFLPDLLVQRERTLGDKTALTLTGKVLAKAWFTEPTYRINLETELLRGLRNGVSDEELSLVRDAVSGRTEPEYAEALQSALARMQARFDAYPNPTVENFDWLDTEHLELNSPASSTAGVHLGAFRFRWDDLVKSAYQDGADDSSAADAQSLSRAGDFSEKSEDPSVANEKGTA